jgi:branched-chain amino acid aminotransferase
MVNYLVGQTTAVAQLQKPPFLYMCGKVMAWDDGKVHVSSEALIRGISVFEGIKGYWRHDEEEFALLALREHFERLTRSALLQQLPFSMTFEEFGDACLSLVRKLLTKERDLWLRPTLFAVEGHWGVDTITDLVITSYHQERKGPAPIEVGVSTWERALDVGLPARIKSPANCQVGRLARMEGRRQGFDDMILLNQWGRVAEASGSCVLIVRNGHVATPPPYEGCLESITVNIVEALCKSLSIPFERRPIDRTELLIADEIALAGTLVELAAVKRLDCRHLPPSNPILDRIKETFWACVRGQRPHAAVHLTIV